MLPRYPSRVLHFSFCCAVERRHEREGVCAVGRSARLASDVREEIQHGRPQRPWPQLHPELEGRVDGRSLVPIPWKYDFQ